MGRLCTICTHPKRDQIDEALLLHTQSYRTIAGRFRVNDTSLKRHEDLHLRTSWEQSKELQAMLSAENLLAKLGQWHERMEQQYAHADEAGNIAGTVATARTGIAAIESFSRLGALAHIARALAEQPAPPQLPPADLRRVLQTLIDAGAARQLPGEVEADDESEATA